MEKKTIKIAGAGISGLTSAIVLAKAGYKVKMFEKNEIVGKRFNEDFQGLLNWGFDQDVLDFMKDIGLETNFWNKPVKNIDIFGPDEYKKSFRTERPFFYLVQRGISKRAFDQSLKEQAIKNGVEIVFNSTIKSEEADIIATGPIFDRFTDGLVMGYTFESDSKDIFAAIFDDKMSYNGYSYFSLADGRGTIATCIFGKYKEISDYLDKTFIFYKDHYSFNIKNQKEFSGSGNFYFLKSNKRYIGEAGGFQDYLWGFGMRYAMITGHLAAKSIIENKDYRNLWKKEVGDLLKTSAANRLWFSWLGKHSYKWAIGLVKKLGDPMKVFTWVYRPNIISRLLYPFVKIILRKHIKDPRKL